MPKVKVSNQPVDLLELADDVISELKLEFENGVNSEGNPADSRTRCTVASTLATWVRLKRELERDTAKEKEPKQLAIPFPTQPKIAK